MYYSINPEDPDFLTAEEYEAMLLDESVDEPIPEVVAGLDYGVEDRVLCDAAVSVFLRI